MLIVEEPQGRASPAEGTRVRTLTATPPAVTPAVAQENSATDRDSETSDDPAIPVIRVTATRITKSPGDEAGAPSPESASFPVAVTSMNEI
jgi:hypothetical protein